MIDADLGVLLPEILLSVFAMLALIGAVYGGKNRLAEPLLLVTAVVFILIAVLVAGSSQSVETAFSETFTNDGFARFAKILILISASVVLVMSSGYLKQRQALIFEYPLLVAFAVGMMVMVSASDLMTLYMGLELQSLSLYVIAAMRRDSLKSTEAGLKYFVLGALSSGLLLYGAS